MPINSFLRWPVTVILRVHVRTRNFTFAWQPCLRAQDEFHIRT